MKFSFLKIILVYNLHQWPTDMTNIILHEAFCCVYFVEMDKVENFAVK